MPPAMKARRLLMLAVCAAGAWGLSAEVAVGAFPQTSREVVLDYLQNGVTVIFDAAGEDAIRSVRPLCDCMTPVVQGSRLVVQVDTSAFDRDVDKQLDVTFADGSHQRLTVQFRVPQLLRVSSRTLVWKQGTAPRPQVLRITLPKGSPIRELRRAELVGDAFDYEPAVVRAGREYTVTITPKSTDKPVLNRLQVVTDCDDFRARRVIFLQVKR